MEGNIEGIQNVEHRNTVYKGPKMREEARGQEWEVRREEWSEKGQAAGSGCMAFGDTGPF